MIWSISGYKQFLRCQRQWYYKNIMANSRIKDSPERREAYVLSKLCTIDAWRGKIVDYVISRIVIPKIKKQLQLNNDQIIYVAKKIFNEQWEFAKNKKYWDNMIALSDDGNIAALVEFEYNDNIETSEIERARSDVETALINFFNSKDLLDYLYSASSLITQRPLSYKVSDYTVKGFPDLIVFFDNQPPHIFDWKVHTFGSKAYDEQLLSYAIGLKKCNPHRDFPVELNDYDTIDIKTTEYQLLKNFRRDYQLTAETLADLENYISSSILTMILAGANKKYDETEPDEFSTTFYCENCDKCPFKRICK